MLFLSSLVSAVALALQLLYFLLCCITVHSLEPYSASKYASDLVSYAFNVRLNSKVAEKLVYMIYCLLVMQ